MILNSPYISGSLTVTGNITSQGGITISGSITSASYATTSSFATTASYANTSTSASYALTASFATNFTASNILASNTITAQTLVVQTVTSSIVYSSGSNIFGNQLTNVQQMTGSVKITGSLSLNNIAIPTSASLASTYLPLAGGTLTGALSGTSATFSGVLTFANGVINNIGSDRFFLGSGGYNYLYCRSTGLQILNQADTTALVTILNSGSVGIGTSTPTSSLNVVKSDNATAAIGSFAANNLSQQTDIWYGGIRMGGTSANVDLNLSSKGTGVVNITGAATFASSVTANSIVSSTTITSTGAISSGGGTISSYSGTPANVSNGGNTTFVYQQASGEFAAGFMYSIIGLYAPSGTNILGVGQGYAYFFADGSTNGTSATAQIASGWSVAASATNAGAFTITFTNNSGATMTSVNYRIIKVNRIGAG